jgi:hypothetical protein
LFHTPVEHTHPAAVAAPVVLGNDEQSTHVSFDRKRNPWEKEHSEHAAEVSVPFIGREAQLRQLALVGI